MVINLSDNGEKQMFAVELFLNNPALTLVDAQFALRHKFGEGINKSNLNKIKRVCMNMPETVRPQLAKYREEHTEKADPRLKELLKLAYDFFNKQDITQMILSETDLSLFDEIEKVIK
jgi:hypothetical protein